jgi:PAS domain S-box-containing protein
MREGEEIVLLLDTDNTVVEANDFALGVYGYSRGELIGRTVDAFRVPQAEVTVADRTRQLEEKGGHLTFASLHRRRDGVEFPVEVSLSVLTIEGEKYYLEIVRDVGERVAADAALRESESRYRTLFENSLSGFALHEVVLDEDGEPVDYVFLAANPAFEEQSGLKVADVLGARATDVVPGLRETGLIERYGRVSLTGDPQRFEAYVPALGRHFDIQVVSPRPRQFATIFTDVTDHRANVVRLARLTRLYQMLGAVMEAVPEEREPDRLYDKVCRIVVEQGGFRLAWVGRKRRNGRVQVVASAGVEGAADEIDVSTRRTAAGLSPVAVALVEGRSDTCGEIAVDPRMAPYRERADRWGLRSLAAVPIVVDGHHDTVLVICSTEPGRFDAEEVSLLERLAADVGFGIEAAGRERARRKAERQFEALNADLELRVRERTDALEAANAELEAFSYSVSHDLRAPLRALDGFSLALLEDYGADLDGDAEDYLNRIRVASQRMARLIDDLLMLSRVTRRGMTRGRVDLSAAARSIGTELADDDPGRQVKLVVTPRMVATGDAQLLDVALRNLLDNAWKFTSRTAGARVEVGMEGEGEDRVFFVRDNGAGFDSQYADKLFAPFQRLHGDDEFPGTGIGLATVQRIVRRHGGRVWAEGATGTGATVWFTLGPGGEVR